MHHHFMQTVERIDRALRQRVRPEIWRFLAPLEVEAWQVADGGEPVTPGHALGLSVDCGRTEPQFTSFELGETWGPEWSTTWFRFTGTIPEAFVEDEDVELRIDLGWFPHSVGGHCEGAAFTERGEIVKGINPKNDWVPVHGSQFSDPLVDPDGHVLLYVEAAANPLLLGLPPFVPTALGEKNSGEEFIQYRLRRADISVLRRGVWEFATDLEVASDVLLHTVDTDPLYWKLARASENALDAFDETDPVDSARRARQLLKPVLDLRARSSSHQVTAVAHSHIDTAWLWPMRETRRKIGRTVANSLNLLDADPAATYAMTSAQHFQWLEEEHPRLFEALRHRVASGTVVPVGGMWVETDGVIPTGESIVRQILLGQKYFETRFGKRSQIMWLPDSFGYSGALPQIAKNAGFRWFLTQKISWNDTTKFPHHSFWWEGIDGTRVFTHFPPSDTYAAELTAGELIHSVENFRDKAFSDQSLLLYGYGDGGGGPTREMSARARRFHDFDGVPRVRLSTPEEFFESAEAELIVVSSDAPTMAPLWKGELYLELHRGALTTQVAMKQSNRRAESWMRALEWWFAWRTLYLGDAYPVAELDDLWKKTLVLQFHDVLPGTSIPWVHREARDCYADIEEDATRLASLAGPSTCLRGPLADEVPVSSEPIAHPDGSLTLENDFLRVKVDQAGRVTSLQDKVNDRELGLRDAPLGELQVLRDEPVRWDAWDIDRSAMRHPIRLTEPREFHVLKDGWEVRFDLPSSTVTVQGRLVGDSLQFAADVDWHERERLLKVAFPLAIAANSVKCETQYGFVERPVYPNTPRDDAMFEASMHRYVHVSDTSYGVGLLNRAMYGMDSGPVLGGVLVRFSLLRGPLFPDPTADVGKHHFEWAIQPGKDVGETTKAASRFNAVAAAPVVADSEFVQVLEESGAVCLDWVKLAEDGSGDLILRLYEPSGGEAKASIVVAERPGGWGAPMEIDLMEHPIEGDSGREWPSALVGSRATAAGLRFDLQMRAFGLTTIRVPAPPAQSSEVNPRNEQDPQEGGKQ